MITGRHVREMLDSSPFKPFRLWLTDGSHHDVLHPEVAWVWGNRVFVGEQNGEGDSVKQLSILHLTRIEEAPKAARGKK